MFDIDEPDDVFIKGLIAYANSQPTTAPFTFNHLSVPYDCWFDTESLSWKDGRKVVVLRPREQDLNSDPQNYALIYDDFTHFYYSIDTETITFHFYSLGDYINNYFDDNKQRIKILEPLNSYGTKKIVLRGQVVTGRWGDNFYYPSHSWNIISINRGKEFDTDYCESKYYCSQKYFFITSENEKMTITYRKYNSEIFEIEDIESELVIPAGHCCAKMNVEIVSIPMPNVDTLTPLQRMLFQKNVELSWDTASMRICTHCKTAHK